MSTADILKCIPVWFSGEKFVEYAKSCTVQHEDDDGNPQGEYELLLKTFPNPKKWRREEKTRQEGYAPRSYIAVCGPHKGETVTNPATFDMNVDFIEFGEYNKELYDATLQAWKDINYVDNKKYFPWLRIYTPKHDDLADTYRLEVYTTPDDKEVILWQIVVD